MRIIIMRIMAHLPFRVSSGLIGKHFIVKKRYCYLGLAFLLS